MNREIQNTQLSSAPFVNHRRLVFAAIVLGVFALAGIMGVVTAKLPARFDPILVVVAAAAPLGLIALGLLVNYRGWMPVMILVAAAFIPISLPTGTGSRLVDSLLLTIVFTVLWVLRLITVERRFTLVPHWLNIPLLFFMILTLWSIGWSILFRDPLVYASRSFIIVQAASGITNVMLGVAFLMVNNFIHNLRMLKVLTGVMLAAGALGLFIRYDLIRLPVNIVNVEGLFTMWIIALATALVLFCARWKPVWRMLVGVMAGLYIYWGFILHISWLAGWLPGLIVLCVLIWQRSRKAVFAILVAAAIFAALNFSEFQKAFEAENAESGHTRLAAWAQNWSITKDHLLFGTGPAGYAAYYMSYFPTNAMATHSNYIDLLAQNGIVGFVPIAVFFCGLAWTGWRLTRRLKGRGDFEEALANAAFAGTVSCIAAMFFGDWLFPFAYTQTIAGFDYAVYSWLFMGTILVLDRLTQPQAEAGAIAHA
jgi:O-antigen ligase